MYKILFLFFASFTAQAASNCLDLSGHYTHYKWGKWITKAHLVQNGCESIKANYTIPSGMQWSRTLHLNGQEYITGQDGQGLVHYESCTISGEGIQLKGRTEDEGLLKESWRGSWTLGPQGELLDYVETFDPTGKSQGPVTIKFLRD